MQAAKGVDDEGSDTAKGDVPAVGAGHAERTPGMLKDMRKSRVSAHQSSSLC